MRRSISASGAVVLSKQSSKSPAGAVRLRPRSATVPQQPLCDPLESKGTRREDRVDLRDTAPDWNHCVRDAVKTVFEGILRNCAQYISKLPLGSPFLQTLFFVRGPAGRA